MTLTEAETKALLASALLVLLAAVGRVVLQPAAADSGGVGLTGAGNVDSALAAAEAVYAERERRRESLAPGERLDPNLADEVELDRLPGVGPATAGAIVRSRRKDGPFRSLAELERVPGLGSTTIERLAPHIALPRSAGRERGSGRERARSTQRDERSKQERRLDLNRATAKDLEALPGIGPARAAAIVRWREEHGGYKSVEELLQVRGIGAATLKRLRPLLSVGP